MKRSSQGESFSKMLQKEHCQFLALWLLVQHYYHHVILMMTILMVVAAVVGVVNAMALVVAVAMLHAGISVVVDVKLDV